MNRYEPAYPLEIPGNSYSEPETYRGLSKRELIAAMVLQGLLSNPHLAEVLQSNYENLGALTAAYIKKSVEDADKLLDQLEKY